MGKVVRIIGIDISKRYFQLHGAPMGRVLPQAQGLRLTDKPVCRVVMEVCASAHHWGRQIQALGHDVGLIPPVYVKPYARGRRTMRTTRERSSRRPSGRRCDSWP